MTEEKKAMDVQNNTDSMGEGMTADRAQNIKGTLKRFFKDLMKQKGKDYFHIYLVRAVSDVYDFNTDTDQGGD